MTRPEPRPPEPLFTDTCNAVNHLIYKGLLHPETCYKFVEEKGKWMVLLWLENPVTGETYGAFKSKPVDIITGAGKLEVVRGGAE